MAPIRALFLGTPDFAVPSLEALDSSDEIEVSLVVTQPDRRSGRGRKLQPPAVKVAAESHDLPVFQPESLRNESVIQRLQNENPDVLVVVSYGELLRKPILEMAPHGCLNVHPSLLPDYRGAVPIPATILSGDNQGGISIMKLVRRMDAGPVLFQAIHQLEGSETTGELTPTLAGLAAEYLPHVVRDWVSGDLAPEEQDESRATYTRELKKSDAQINWNWDSQCIDRFVRAMDPWPRAWTLLEGERISILTLASETGTQGAAKRPGTVVQQGERVYVVTSS
ncbi:MAG: methionyl-tRNA formyltransferase, partial [Thermomicrobiaceae bacterium]